MIFKQPNRISNQLLKSKTISGNYSERGCCGFVRRGRGRWAPLSCRWQLLFISSWRIHVGRVSRWATGLLLTTSTTPPPPPPAPLLPTRSLSDRGAALMLSHLSFLARCLFSFFCSASQISYIDRRLCLNAVIIQAGAQRCTIRNLPLPTKYESNLI